MSYSHSNFPSDIEEKLDKAYQRNPKGTIEITMSNSTYTVNFSSMIMENQYQRPYQIMRVEREINKRKVNVKELNALFKEYKQMDEPDEDAESYYRDNDAEAIGGNGILKFCEDHKIDPSSIDLLYLFYKLKCHRKYYLNYNEFVKGLASLDMETSAKIKTKISTLKKNLTSLDEKKKFYRWTYDYLLDPNQKTVNKELTLATWPLFISHYQYFEDWMDFIRNEYPHAPSKDLWNQLFDFINDRTITTFEEYDFSMSAYNTAIDDFVSYMLKKKSGKK